MFGSVNLVLGVGPWNPNLVLLGDLDGLVMLKMSMMLLSTLVDVKMPSGYPDGMRLTDFAAPGSAAGAGR